MVWVVLRCGLYLFLYVMIDLFLFFIIFVVVYCVDVVIDYFEFFVFVECVDLLEEVLVYFVVLWICYFDVIYYCWVYCIGVVYCFGDDGELGGMVGVFILWVIEG